jgi:CelD/BcsL family acetyltransferase involved in cellulose biosynthesis
MHSITSFDPETSMSEWNLERFDGDPAEWDAFVEASNNGTIFHRLAYLAYHENRFDDNAHHLAWRQGGELRAVLPLGIFEEDGGIVARSPFGASYGGIVVRSDLSLVEAERLVASLVEYLGSKGVDRLVVTPTPSINHERPQNYVDFWLLKMGATVPRSELTSYIEVSAEPLEAFRYAAVKAVRKARANDVAVEQSDWVDEFYEILAANRRKFGAEPTHSKEEIEWLLRKLPDHVRLFMAYLDRKPIAGSLVFRVNRRVLLDFYWAHLDEYQGLRPISLLVHEITRWAHGEGLRYFDFGTQTIEMVPVEGSTRFKETFGALGVFRHTYRLDLAGGR